MCVVRNLQPTLAPRSETGAAADTASRMMCQPAFTVTTSGPAPLTAPLADALQAQWQLGFPRTPDGVDQLTNGFYTYPAALQTLASRHLMRVVPEGPLLDPFCGSGTAVIEALRAGRDATGADASPLALWVAGAHTWRPEPAQANSLTLTEPELWS